jgi:hypothetical protein
VLVEHGLRHPSALGDVVHRGGVVALGDEDLEGRLEQLDASFASRHPTAAGSRGIDVGLACGHVVLLNTPE